MKANLILTEEEIVSFVRKGEISLYRAAVEMYRSGITPIIDIKATAVKCGYNAMELETIQHIVTPERRGGYKRADMLKIFGRVYLDDVLSIFNTFSVREIVGKVKEVAE